MGVYIEGMEMPETCEDCCLESFCSLWIEARRISGGKATARHPDCPLAKIPLHVKPVVLCRDCKYSPSETDDGESQGFGLEWPHDEWPEYNPCPCKCEDGWYSFKPAPDFFCAVGERNSENNAERSDLS